MVLVSARKGAASYFGGLDNLPAKIEKHFSRNSRIIIYPQQFDRQGIHDQYEDFTTESINKGIETVQRLGRGVGKIFKKSGNL